MNKEQDIDNQLYKYLSPDLYCYIHNYIVDLKNANNQLTNNWNELEKHLNHEIEEWQDVSDDWTKAQVQEDKIILERMKEIKEGNNVSSGN